MSVFVSSNLFLMLLSGFLLLLSSRAINANEQTIQLPPGFKLSVYADDKTKQGHLLSGARYMAFDAAGNLYVTSAKGDRLVHLSDTNRDGVADAVELVSAQLNKPQGIVFLKEEMFVANQDGVVKFTKDQGKWIGPKPLITGLSTGWHSTKTLKLGPDGYFYINVGSSCNVCVEEDPTRATILRYTPEGQAAGMLTTLGRHAPSAIWARGLRNAQGFAWHPVTGAMYATNNGADNRSHDRSGKVNDDLPPEHLNIIEGGKHYGWPHCWADPEDLKTMFEDPNFRGSPGFCEAAQAPAIIFKSHTTPLGITFLNKTNWPANYQTDAVVALHGSWNRKEPAGYQLVRVKFKDNVPVAVEDFATGWLKGYRVSGRPVDVAVGPDGALYVTDDMRGAVYRITYQSQ